MQTVSSADRYVVGRDRNVVLVDFGRRPDPPAPRFPGAGALRTEGAEDNCWDQHSDGFAGESIGRCASVAARAHPTFVA
jgi:hypothetical protein